MNIRAVFCAFVLLVGAVLASAQGEAKPFLHPLFADHMVLQRGIAAPVWGWTTPGAKVTVIMGATRATGKAAADGRWQVKIGPFTPGGPYTMKVSGPQTVTVQDVLVGDVWICSGQSNMQMGIGLVQNAQQEIANAKYPNIRLCLVDMTIGMTPKNLVNLKWSVCTPENVAAGGWGGFSAVGYFFGRELYENLHIPIGLIDSSWGGTVAQAWTSKEGLAGLHDFDAGVKQVMEIGADQQGYIDRINKGINDWWALDPGTTAGWGAKTDLDTGAWKTMTLPAGWRTAGLPNYNGVVWFSKIVELPQEWAGKPLTLNLGTVVNRDVTYFNGTRVGGLDWYWQGRSYTIPGNLVKAGANRISVRVLDTGYGGGFTGKPEMMSLWLNGSTAKLISLAGEWKYQATHNATEHPYPPERIDGSPNNPTVLYNGMISPLVPLGITGAIWYQGESNAGYPKYDQLMAALITDWGARFGVREFPFYQVSLANFMARETQPTDTAWARLRESQRLAAVNVPNCGQAITIDIGDAADIHPRNKQDVGKRLALYALARTYGKQVEFAGPIFKRMVVEGKSIRLHFYHLGGGLVARGGKLTGFAVAGADKKYVWADAVIDGNSVVVSSPEVARPLAVRYAWGNNPECNLYNKAGLPAWPFKTDSD